jgi:alkylhydroperoxidase family enzyme
MTTMSEHGALPLAPLDRPSSLFVRILYSVTRRRYGKTPMAFRVFYARNPWVACVSLLFTFIASACLRLDRELRFLVPISLAMRAGCTFCADLTAAEAVKNEVGKERFRDLLDFEASPAYSAREKAALAYAAAVHESLRVDDAVLARLREHFDEREIVEIAWLCAVERYYNTMALPMRIGSDGLAGDLR